MNKWEAITGIIILLIGLSVFWQSSNSLAQCNSIGGKISTAITSIFGGSGAQACYDSGILQVGSILVAIIGVVLLYFAAVGKKSGR